MKKTVSYKDSLVNRLKDRNYAALYLNAALEENTFDEFLLALGYVAEAMGVSVLAKKTSLNRPGLYKIFSKKGNPRLSSLGPILDALGLRIRIEAKKKLA